MNNSLSTHNSVITPDLFWHAINILVTKPHIVNKRIWGCKLLGRYSCKTKKSWELSILPVKLQDPSNINVFLSDLITFMDMELIMIDENNDMESEIILTELLPKSYSETHAFQLIFLQKHQLTATFYDITSNNQNICPNFSYRFYLQDNALALMDNAGEQFKCHQWLMTTVLPQVSKWSQEARKNTLQSVNKSLALVPEEQYYNKYNDLKEKYGKELVKFWPECTDPSKFVYEDIAIATYLLLLWEEKHDECDIVKPQHFVDMGCGNGLLVYLLTMEGHSGYGIDVRKRKIWDMYPGNIKLLEKTITPSNIQTFTDLDWIIGNHSDELTPWIPVIAAQSSYKCKFFLLPCCAYHFDGTKYQRRNSSVSQYTDYLQYIHKLSDDCGFETCTDRLKIPSTKRICFVGKRRRHHQAEYNEYCKNIDILVKSSMHINSSETDKYAETENFKAREATEKVRNCTKVDKNVTEIIISSVAKYLLEDSHQSSEWSLGKTVDISEIVSLLSPDILKSLKSECGGLQTLLKNNHHIFKVGNGKIQLQYPKTVNEMNNRTMQNKRFKLSIKLKQKECWFYRNHPQGCPLEDTECSFMH